MKTSETSNGKMLKRVYRMVKLGRFTEALEVSFTKHNLKVYKTKYKSL